MHSKKTVINHGRNLLLGLSFLSVTAGANAFAGNQSALLAYMRVQPGTQQQFLDAAQNVIAESRKEPGNLVYNLHQSKKNPQEFVLYEMFRTKDDLTLHKNSSYVKDFLNKVQPILIPDNGFVLDQYEVLDASQNTESK